MKRKIYKQLLKWKEDKDRKPLILLGARQVGKTWIMQHFGKQEYDKVAYVNCDDEPRMKQLFELDYNIDRILLTLQAITGTKVTPGDTLIIRARSLAQFIKDNPHLKGLRISMKGYIDQGWMENIPLIAINSYLE